MNASTALINLLRQVTEGCFLYPCFLVCEVRKGTMRTLKWNDVYVYVESMTEMGVKYIWQLDGV